MGHFTMATVGTLYTYPANFRAYKALIAAQYSGSKINVASDFVFGETNKSEQFLSKFPLGKVPAFETQSGECIAESNAIAYYVANQQLRGNNDVDKAQVLQWMNFADSEVLPLSCTIVFPILGIIQYNKQAVEQAKAELKKTCTALNDCLLTRTYLVGERITLADIVVACNFLHLYEHVGDEGNRKPYANLNRWFTTLINQTEFKAVIGEFNMCQKEAEVDPKKFSEFQGKVGPLSRTRKKRKRRRRRKNQRQHLHLRNPNQLKRWMPPMKPYPLSLSQKILLMPRPKEPSTLKISNVSTPTTMKPSRSLTSGRNSTRRTTPSGWANTNTMKN